MATSPSTLINLPSKVNVNYLDLNLDYSPNTQEYRRQLAPQDNSQEISLPLVLTADEARTIAERTLILQWLEDRETITIELPPALLYIEVGDILLLPGEETHLEITQMDIGADFRISVQCRPYDKHVLSYIRSLTQLAPIDSDFVVREYDRPVAVRGSRSSSGRIGISIGGARGVAYQREIDYIYNPKENTITILSTGNIPLGEELILIQEGTPMNESTIDNSISHTYFEILDIPLINDESQEGLYYMGNGDDGWRGGVVYTSFDDVRYTYQGTIEDRGVFGVCQNILGQVSDASALDTINTVTVVLTGDLVQMESVTEIDLDNGLNKALVGEEIIQFRDAIENIDGTWTLRNLRRGIRGTEAVMNNHVGEERFALLTGDDAVVSVLPLTPSLMGQKVYVKSLSPGQRLLDVPAISIIIKNSAYQPYAPAELTATTQESGDVIITWERRDRRAGDWGKTYAFLPLSESTENYSVEIKTRAGTTIRSFDTHQSPVTYSLQGQETDLDFGTTIIEIVVYQKSLTIGNGKPAKTRLSVTLVPPDPPEPTETPEP